MLVKALFGDLHISPHFILREEFHLDYMNSYKKNQSNLLVSLNLPLNSVVKDAAYLSYRPIETLTVACLW